MNTKKQLKAELNLDSVSTINNLLKAAGRTTKVIRSSKIEDADESLVRKALPHLSAGKSYAQAVKLAKAEIRGAQIVEEEEETSIPEPPNNGKGNLTIHQKVQIQQRTLAKKQESQMMKLTAEKATELAEKTQAAKWLYWAAAEGSEQVQESDLVTKARDFALGVVGSDLSEDSMLAELEEQMESFGFFALNGSFEPALEGTTEETDSFSSLPDYSFFQEPSAPASAT
ncbi:MAG: hypothetical protein F6K31_07255 [Symploca sp. SIO2G7]|nr:hypothetical protein [Symploca sp. SIO2G7]